MPGYIKKTLKLFQHTSKQKQNAPYPTTAIKYGAKQQYAQQESTAPPLNKKGKKVIQQVCGKLLFLGRAVDITLLCPISAIAAQSSKPTEHTLRYPIQFLDYIATQEEEFLTFNASDMKLAVHTNPKQEAGQGDTSSCPATQPYHQTMALYSTLRTLSDM